MSGEQPNSGSTLIDLLKNAKTLKQAVRVMEQNEMEMVISDIIDKKSHIETKNRCVG